MIETLILLEEKTRMMEERMGRIEAKMNEFIDNKNVDSSTKKNRARAVACPKAHRCALGRVMLALGILGLVMPSSSSELTPPSHDKEASIAMRTLTKRGWSWPQKMSPSYRRLPPLLEDFAQGIEERQAKLEEMARGIENVQNELKKVAKSMEEKQALLEKATKDIEGERIKRIEEDG
jgi:hypothetical protein